MHRPASLSALCIALAILLTCLQPATAGPQPAQQPRQGAGGGGAAETPEHWPVAVRWWGQAFVTIETWWGLTVAIDPYGADIGYADPNVSADLVLVTHAHADHNNPGLVKGDPAVFRGLEEDGSVRELEVVLDRKPNEEEPTVAPRGEAGELSPNAIVARTIASFHDDQQGAQRGRNAMWLIEADGTRILHMGDFGQRELTSEQLEAIGRIDVMLIPVGGVYTVDGAGAAKIVEQVRPRIVVPIHHKTEPLKIGLQDAQAFLGALPESYRRAEAKGNTLAVSAQKGEAEAQPRVVSLDWRPWQTPPELAGLFEAIEAAQQRSAEVFRPLSAGQMNFRPSNGTHTPRWNVEHMNATELSMLSAFYAAADPEITRIVMRPEQMPPDYVPANPEWTGAEEARQIERTRAFARRFAYLLDGQGLDAQAQGAPWPLGRVLEVMARHYNEHTGNVEKKFDLPDWPKE